MKNKEKFFLVEIGSEELPINIIKSLVDSFTSEIKKRLTIKNIKFKNMKSFSTSCRIAIQLIILELEKTKERNQLNNSKNNRKNVKSSKFIKNNLRELMIKIVDGSLLEILKSYNVVSKKIDYLNFIRPIKNVTVLINNFLIKGKILGLNTSKYVYGNKFISKNKVLIKHAKDYCMLLRKQCVLVDYEERKQIIIQKINFLINKIKGSLEIYNNFVEEITYLVEWPVALIAKFKKEFLILPSEIILYVLTKYNNFLPIFKKNKKLSNYFIFFLNIESKNSEKLILENEKALNNRLQDIKISYDIDCKHKLKYNLIKLNNIIFKENLGSMLDRSYRIAMLSQWISKNIGSSSEHAYTAGILSKCDLVTNLVTYFPEMQGIAGMHYAKKDGKNRLVYLSQKEQYYYGIKLPTNMVSCAVAIANRIDILVGILNNYKPCSSNDPFKLRRSALGIINIIIIKKIKLNIFLLINYAIKLYNCKISSKTLYCVLNFIQDRLFAMYKKMGFKKNIIMSVFPQDNKKKYDLLDIDLRINAINKIYKKHPEEMKNLLETNKRIKNILLSSSSKNKIFKITITELKKDIDIYLYKELINAKKKIEILMLNKLYFQALLNISRLFYLVNKLIDNTKINDYDLNIKENRMYMLTESRNLLLKIANL